MTCEGRPRAAPEPGAAAGRLPRGGTAPPGDTPGPDGPNPPAPPAGGMRGLPRAPRCLVMGVVNVTPDSFSDGGNWLAPDAAIARGVSLAAAGADSVDVGGGCPRAGAPRHPGGGGR